MGVIASWMGKQWEISPSRIIALHGMTTSLGLDAETNQDDAGQSPTNVRKLKLQSFSLDWMLNASAGADVRAEIESWKELIGEFGPLLLGGKQFGPEKLQLTDISLSNFLFNNNGQILETKISIKLNEYAPEPSGDKASGAGGSAGGSGGGAPGIRGGSSTPSLPGVLAAGLASLLPNKPSQTAQIAGAALLSAGSAGKTGATAGAGSAKAATTSMSTATAGTALLIGASVDDKKAAMSRRK